MRTTIDLPTDLHDAARSIARDRGTTLSEAVADLIRRGLGQPDTVTFGRRGTAIPGQVCLADRHRFWPDGVAYHDVDLDGVVGHRQVTDAYLAALAGDRGVRVATFDRGLVAVHPDVVDLVPV